MDQRPHRPGDYVLDRYMPDATPEEREDARETLRQFAIACYAIISRLEREQAQRDSRGRPSKGTIPS